MYNYFPNSHLVESIDRPGPTGRLITRFAPQGDAYPVTVTAPDGTVTTRTFDDLGRVETVTASTGAVTTIDAYDDQVQGTGEALTTVATSAAGISTTTLNRNELGFVTSSRTATPGQLDRLTLTDTNALGWSLENRTGTQTSRTVYDSDGRIDSITSGSGSGDGFSGITTTVPGYTSAGMINTITRSENDLSEVSSMIYDDAGRLETSTTAGLATTYTYDTVGHTRTRTEGLLPPTLYGYDAAGRLQTTTSPGGKTSTNVFDKLGRQVGRIDPAGIREDLTLVQTGQLQVRKLLDDSGNVWSWEENLFDHLGRMNTRTIYRFPVTPLPDSSFPVALSTTTAYYEIPDDPRLGLVKTITDTLGRVTTFDYDDAGRELTRTLPDGTEITTTYAGDGKVESRTVAYQGPEGAWQLTTATTYDDQGRVKTVTAPGGQVTTTFYDDLGRKQSQLTADSVPGAAGEEYIDRLTSWDYGDLGRRVTTNRPDGAQITREYDERGNLRAYIDTDENRTEYLYDDYGKLETITYPDLSTKSFTYLDDGEVDTITRADGSVVNFGYEPITGRLESISVAGGVQPGGQTNFGYDPVGHLLSTSNTDVALAFTWDSLGNQLSESLALPGVAPSIGTKGLIRTFDLGNRPETLSLPDGMPNLTRGYDLGDRLTSLDLGSQTIWQATHAGGRLTRFERGNGLTTTFAYDSQGRPTDITTGIPDAGGVIADPVHRLGLGWTEGNLRRSKSRTDLNRAVETFHYDGVGHLEGNEIDRIPAISEGNQDLATVTGMNPRSLEEWWTVNTVDELAKRTRVLEGRQEAAYPQHNNLHQVEKKAGRAYTWDVNGNLETQGTIQEDTSVLVDTTYSHDWRDRLVGVEQADATTRLVIDPLGRLVAKVKQTVSGDATRIYLHDGDQVVAEYVQETGGSNFQLDRRKTWGRWIDDLVSEEVDTDHDGNLETRLYPVKDLLGSVQLLTDESGSIVERIDYDADGTPHFWSADTNPPTVTRMAWTGNGNRPTGDVVAASIFEIGFDEWIDEASMASAIATLIPDGESAQILTLTLDAGVRGAVLAGASVSAGTSYTLHLEGLKDRTGNAIAAVDAVFTIDDGAEYEVVHDTAAPQVLAVMDATDGIYFLIDEPVVAQFGVNLSDTVTVRRAGVVVPGSTERAGAGLVRWTADDPATWLVLGDYVVTSVQLVDLAGQAVDTSPLPVNLTHLASDADSVLVAYEATGDSVLRGESAYGVTSLFQGRGWHSDLGLYYYRARWYAPGVSAFLERDPVAHVSQSAFHWMNSSPVNVIDPAGTYAIDFHYYAVYFLARSAGLNRSDATTVSWSSQYVDESTISKPTKIEAERLYPFHFVAPRFGYVQRANPIAKLNLARAERNGSLISLGIALHSWADTWAHEGFSGMLNARGGVGHILDLRMGLDAATLIAIDNKGYNRWPDQPYRAVGKATEAARTSFSVLSSASIRHGGVSRFWKSIENDVRKTFGVVGDINARILAWKTLIAIHFPLDGNIDFPRAEPRGWLALFNRYAKEQQRFVMDMRKNPNALGPQGRVFDVTAPSPPYHGTVPPGLGRGYQ